MGVLSVSSVVKGNSYTGYYFAPRAGCWEIKRNRRLVYLVAICCWGQEPMDDVWL